MLPSSETVWSTMAATSSGFVTSPRIPETPSAGGLSNLIGHRRDGLAVDIREHDVGAVLGEAEADAGAIASRATCNQGCFSLEERHGRSVLSCSS